MSHTVLKRAGKLFHRRKFSAAVRLLEQQIFRFRESPEFYTLLGKSCLYSGDFGGAGSYLQRADQLRKNDITILLALAVVALKRSDTEEALERWLKVLDLDPGNRLARRGLDLLRRTSGGSLTLAEAQAPAQLNRLLPRIPLHPLRIVLPLVIVVLAAAVFSGVYFLKPALPTPQIFKSPPKRDDVPDITLESERPSLIDETALLTGNQSGFNYLMDEKAIRASFDRAKAYLADYRDNLALREINRILLSNASVYVKERARALAAFVREPDFTTIRDPFPYSEVAREPSLYPGSYVVWAGRVANLAIGQERIDFDLLVGYEEGKELLGIVRVSIDFPVVLENGIALEVLGRVRTEAGRIALDGLSIHKLGGL